MLHGKFKKMQKLRTGYSKSEKMDPQVSKTLSPSKEDFLQEDYLQKDNKRQTT